MTAKKKSKLRWRKLDNSAKIFPIVSNKKFSAVFRMSVVLKEPIEKEILEEATNRTLGRFVSFKVRLRKGFFWYYLEYNPKEPIVELERTYPCKYIDPNTNNNYLFKVTYFENKINVDIFHSLTDGNSATRFFKELIYQYIEIKHKGEKKFSSHDDKRVSYNNTEDEYIKNYNKKAKGNASSKKAYVLKGKKLPLDAISVVHEKIDIQKLREIAKLKGATVTQYLTANLICSIQEANYKYYHRREKKPIKICIPVNLKKYISSTTISNFFSYITIEANMYKGDYKNFEEVLEFVKQDFKDKLTEENVIATMSNNVKLGTNIFIRLLPLFIKKFTVKMSYIEIRKYTTTTFSNIGRIGILPEYKEYIQDFLFLIAPEQVEKIKCSACSYENHLVFTITSTLKDNHIAKDFAQRLEGQGIEVQIEGNGVYESIS